LTESFSSIADGEFTSLDEIAHDESEGVALEFLTGRSRGALPVLVLASATLASLLGGEIRGFAEVVVVQESPERGDRGRRGCFSRIHSRVRSTGADISSHQAAFALLLPAYVTLAAVVSGSFRDVVMNAVGHVQVAISIESHHILRDSFGLELEKAFAALIKAITSVQWFIAGNNLGRGSDRVDDGEVETLIGIHEASELGATFGIVLIVFKDGMRAANFLGLPEFGTVILGGGGSVPFHDTLSSVIFRSRFLFPGFLPVNSVAASGSIGARRRFLAFFFDFRRRWVNWLGSGSESSAAVSRLLTDEFTAAWGCKLHLRFRDNASSKILLDLLDSILPHPSPALLSHTRTLVGSAVILSELHNAKILVHNSDTGLCGVNAFELGEVVSAIGMNLAEVRVDA